MSEPAAHTDTKPHAANGNGNGNGHVNGKHKPVQEFHAPELIHHESSPLKAAIAKADMFAPFTDMSVLLTGKTGTGKEIFAQRIHEKSGRQGDFVAINCAGISPTLIESELFGHEKGAFTGADKQRQGVFERAKDGTVFLDEIGEMPMEMQTKLLRALQEKEFTRVGGSDPIKVNPRIISATNRSPSEAISEGKLRRDLYYRLRGTQIHLPRLRDRKQDIPLLAEHFVYAAMKPYPHLPVPNFSPESIQALQEYSWPGNLREMKSRISEAAIMAQQTPTKVITPEILKLPKKTFVEKLESQKDVSKKPRTMGDIKRDIIKLVPLEKYAKMARDTGLNIDSIRDFYNAESTAMPYYPAREKFRTFYAEKGKGPEFEVLLNELMDYKRGVSKWRAR